MFLQAFCDDNLDTFGHIVDSFEHVVLLSELLCEGLLNASGHLDANVGLGGRSQEVDGGDLVHWGLGNCDEDLEVVVIEDADGDVAAVVRRMLLGLDGGDVGFFIVNCEDVMKEAEETAAHEGV
jgi:hypothetical protein